MKKSGKDMYKSRFDEYITESKWFIWYISSFGRIYKESKKTGKLYILSGTIKEGDLVYKIKGKSYLAKNLAAEKFMRDWYPGCCVGMKSGIKNFDIENLYIYSMEEHGKNTGYLSKGRQVIVHDGEDATEYRSVRAAAKNLFVSYQTLLDYLNNHVKHSVIHDMPNIVVRYKDGL